MKIRKILLGALLSLQLANITGSMNSCANEDALRIFDPAEYVKLLRNNVIHPFMPRIDVPDISADNRMNLAQRLPSQYLERYGPVEGPQFLLAAARIHPEMMYVMGREYRRGDSQAFLSTTFFLASYGIPEALDRVCDWLTTFPVPNHRWHKENPEAALHILLPHVHNNEEWALNRNLYVLHRRSGDAECHQFILKKAREGVRWGFQKLMESIRLQKYGFAHQNTDFPEEFAALNDLVDEGVLWAIKEKAWICAGNAVAQKDFSPFREFIAPHIKAKKPWVMRVKALGLVFGMYGRKQDTAKGMAFIQKYTKKDAHWANELLAMAYYCGWINPAESDHSRGDKPYVLHLEKYDLRLGVGDSKKFKRYVREKMFAGQKWAIDMAMRLQNFGYLEYNRPKHTTEFAGMKESFREAFLECIIDKNEKGRVERNAKPLQIFNSQQEFFQFVDNQVSLGNNTMARKKFDLIRENELGYTGGFRAAMAFMQDYVRDHPQR